MTGQARQNTELALSAVACVLAAVVLFYGPYLARIDLFYDDVAHHVFWLYRYADPTLYPNDISIPYFQTSAPWGYRALYAAIAQFGDVLQGSEWVALAVMLVSAWLVWKIAAAAVTQDRALYGLLAVLTLVVFIPLSMQRDLIPPTGFQRTFSMPLLLLTLWGLVSRKYAWVGVSWLAAALLYPVTLPVQGLAAAIVFLRDMTATRRLPPHWILNGVLGAAALGIAAFSLPIPAEVGPALTYEEAMQIPEFGPGGRLDLYHAGTWSWVVDYSTGLGWTHGLLLAMALGVGLAFILGRIRTIPFAAWAIVVVGVGLWTAMRAFPEELMFGLYLPNRHSRWAIGVFGIFAVAAGAQACAHRLAQWWTQNGARRGELNVRRWIAIAAPFVALAALLPSGLRTWNRPVDTDLENVYAFIATLPKDTVVAAHPDLADFVPIRTHRSVLTSSETSMAWMRNYYAQMKPRVEASLRAAYATRIEEVDTLLAPYDVDVMVSGPSVWTKTGYFVPFDDLAKSLVKRGEQEGFALQNPPPERVLFRSGEYYVVRMK